MSEWIEWPGGECPVAPDTLVDVRHDDDTITYCVKAGDAVVEDPRYGFDWWQHQDVSAYTDGFIRAYRVVSK